MNPSRNIPPDPVLAQHPAAVVYAYDLSGNITFLNHEGERILGYSREEACRMNIVEVFDQSLAGRIPEQILRDATEPIGAVYEVDVIAKDGRRIALEASTRVVLRDRARVEIHGIAVPSVIRTHSESRVRAQCVDDAFLLQLHSDC